MTGHMLCFWLSFLTLVHNAQIVPPCFLKGLRAAIRIDSPAYVARDPSGSLTRVMSMLVADGRRIMAQRSSEPHELQYSG